MGFVNKYEPQKRMVRLKHSPSIDCQRRSAACTLSAQPARTLRAQACLRESANASRQAPVVWPTIVKGSPELVAALAIALYFEPDGIPLGDG